jgi:hypothetical protein
VEAVTVGHDRARRARRLLPLAQEPFGETLEILGGLPMVSWQGARGIACARSCALSNGREASAHSGSARRFG